MAGGVGFIRVKLLQVEKGSSEPILSNYLVFEPILSNYQVLEPILSNYLVFEPILSN
jgi:hypothetical protein